MTPADELACMTCEPQDGWPSTHVQVMNRQAAELERLREHVVSLHRLNGWSKTKGWWCSCGWRSSITHLGVGRMDGPRPWERRADAEREHAAHVREVAT